MNYFGGNWTEQKIETVVSYVKAYLTIMNNYPQFKTLYFDGFAGSGLIFRETETDFQTIKGTAIRVLEIEHPKTFDQYYFVEKNESNKLQLEILIKENFSNRKFHVVNEDCNVKLKSLAKFLATNKDFRVLAFIDPYGMTVDWESLRSLKGLGVDMWILVPTGIGVNRLLTSDYEISEAWLLKLERFLGMQRPDILDHFYKSQKTQTLFGEETLIIKEQNAIQKAGILYRTRLLELFKYVSNPFPLRNSTGSIMYHFMMASNNAAALKIANDIIKPKLK